MWDKVYIAIDLKSYYASVECIERGFDPMNTNLVVADKSKTDKTICLAVSPSLKKLGVPGRPRLFEVNQKIKEINSKRLTEIEGDGFTRSSFLADEISRDPFLKVDYFAAPPRMRFYIEYSTKIYRVYLKYFSEKDIYVYSIDEAFFDATNYLKTYGMTAKELTKTIISDVKKSTGISSTAGIGSNLYLSKIAMDIGAKHVAPDEDGVRIAELDEYKYRKYLWGHKPITDFWRIGSGYARSLAKLGIYTMGDIAKCSISNKKGYFNEDLLYKTFGVNAELLIDHAWGYEPVTMKEIKSYRPKNSSISSGQVLSRPYEFEEAKLILKEMSEGISLELCEKKLLTRQIVISVSYDVENVVKGYIGETKIDGYGRVSPKKVRGTVNFSGYTCSTSEIMDALVNWFEEKVDEKLTIRRFNLSANFLIYKDDVKADDREQISFLDYLNENSLVKENSNYYKKEESLQNATVEIHKKFGKNLLIRGMNLDQGATRKIRNDSIGGHKA